MKFTNAYKDLRFINISEMLNIGSMVVYIAFATMIITLSGGNISTAAIQTVYEAGNGSTMNILNYIMQALSFASYIMMIVGINKAKTDDKNFDSAFSFACIGIVMVVIHLFSGGWFRVLLSAVLGILFLLFRLRIISAVENIAHSLENTDMSGKAKIFSVIFIIFTVISVIFNVVNQAVPDVSILVAGISNIFGIIKSIIFIAYLTKALKMLKE